MSAQALLPILDVPPAATLRTAARAFRLRSSGAVSKLAGPGLAGRLAPSPREVETQEVEYLEVEAREILHRVAGRRQPHTWSVNPYRGCEIGCTYCFARSTHQFLGLGGGSDFERRVLVKRGASAALARQLRHRSFHGQPIAIGTATDPYQPAEARFGVTREILETFAGVEGLDLSLATKSPLVLRDLELLTALDKRHTVTIRIAVATADALLARKLEPKAATPQARLEAAGRLAEAGLRVVLDIAPLLPEINDVRSQLEPLFEAAARHGIDDVHARPLTLGTSARAGFEPWLRKEFPRLVSRYAKLYGRRTHLPKARREQMMARVRLLRMLHGFPRERAGRT